MPLRPIDEASRATSRLLARDTARYTVVWEEAGDELTLGDAAMDRAIALRFVLRDGSLYAFQTTD